MPTTKFDMASPMSDMINFSKKARDDNYDNTYLQYQSQFNEYKALERNNKNLFNKQLNSAKLMALNFKSLKLSFSPNTHLRNCMLKLSICFFYNKFYLNTLR